MQTKLTLRLDAGLVRKAQAYARGRRKSVSAIVADYFATLEAGRGGVADFTYCNVMVKPLPDDAQAAWAEAKKDMPDIK